MSDFKCDIKLQDANNLSANFALVLRDAWYFIGQSIYNLRLKYALLQNLIAQKMWSIMKREVLFWSGWIELNWVELSWIEWLNWIIQLPHEETIIPYM